MAIGSGGKPGGDGATGRAAAPTPSRFRHQAICCGTSLRVRANASSDSLLRCHSVSTRRPSASVQVRRGRRRPYRRRSAGRSHARSSTPDRRRSRLPITDDRRAKRSRADHTMALGSSLRRLGWLRSAGRSPASHGASQRRMTTGSPTATPSFSNVDADDARCPHSALRLVSHLSQLKSARPADSRTRACSGRHCSVLRSHKS